MIYRIRYKLLRVMLVFCALLPLAACEWGTETARRTMPRERFIEVNVALRQIDPQAPEADSVRAAVLAERGVTEEQMLDFVRARGSRPQELAQIWAEIQQRLEIAGDTLSEEGIEEPELEEVEPPAEPSEGLLRQESGSPLREQVSTL